MYSLNFEGMEQAVMTIDFKERILRIREEYVILDKEIAQLYGVTTSALNQAVKRNINRFPTDFMFQLTVEEFDSLKSQIVTANAEISADIAILKARMDVLERSIDDNS